MKLEYKILWLDDKISDFVEDDIIEEVEKYLINSGFDPEIITTDNSKDFFDKLDNSYDIILTDFHMNDMNGNLVVEKIRGSEYSVMTEILFYTAKADLTDTKKISRVSFLETGTRTGSHIDVVLYELKKLIDLTIKKTQNLNNLRGLVMAESSEIDMIMRDILLKINTNYSLNAIGISLCSCGACTNCKRENREYKKYGTTIFKLRKKGTVTKNITGAIPSELLEAIKSFLDSSVNVTGFKSSDIDGYRNDIKRNILAHYPEDSSSRTEIKIIDDNGKIHIFTESKFNQIRKDIRKYKGIFEEIKSKI